jgi:hypothetical protein
MNQLFQSANIKSALIVDDAFDPVPRASDLSVLNTGEWERFFEDRTSEDDLVLHEVWPDYSVNTDVTRLRESDEFVEAIWNHQKKLRSDWVEPLFVRFKEERGTDQQYLTGLQDQLQKFGLSCRTTGRQFEVDAQEVDILFVDLFLDQEQNTNAMNASIEGVCRLIKQRSNRPPIVVLMSRSNRLSERREEFRDKSGLFESAFRVIQKNDLVSTKKLERILTMLVQHHSESLKLAAFVFAWHNGIQAAALRTSDLIRKLDLSDYAQIQQLLLSAEGEPTGSYIVDVFDHVLQHEIEREVGLIDAAKALDGLTTESYPPRHVSGSLDLQSLVYRSLFQNPARLRLSGAIGSQVAFGDVLRRKPGITSVDQLLPLHEIGSDDIVAVMSPSCDLQRGSAKRVLLLVGTLKSLGPLDWSYEDHPLRTSIIECNDDKRYWIKWNLKHIETLSHAELDRVLESPAGFERLVRLRESHALEIQHDLLTNMGRVGQTALIPATFYMRVEAYLPNAANEFYKLDIPELHTNGGVCFVGRSGQKDMRLLFPEDVCEAICRKLELVNSNDVAIDTQPLLEHLKQTDELMNVMIKGIVLPGFRSKEFKDIPAPSAAQNGAFGTIGLILRNSDVPTEKRKPAELKKAGIIFAVWDDDKENSILS